ncbi:MAG: hypothetical protein Q7U76_12775 [Nitrospirota bacterium]|nr:hypothetical protein [Nitrospirota bacterium]
MAMIDKKYKIQAVQAITKAKHTEQDSVLFLAKDKALPATLRFYSEECTRLGAANDQLQGIELLIGRVEDYQAKHAKKVKVADIAPGKEAKRVLQ